MAKMYPEEFPHSLVDERDRGLFAEKLVYDTLKEKLPNDWVVLYNQWRYFLKADKSDYVNYEVDFVVFVPHKGWVVIEVKSWHKPKVENGIWKRFQNGEYNECGKDSPIQQAYLGMNKLFHEELKYIPGMASAERRTLAILCGQADNYDHVHYCSADDRAANYLWERMYEENDIFQTLYVIGDEALNDIKNRIERVFVFQNVRFSKAQIDMACNQLLQNVRFKESPKVCIAMMDKAAAGLDNILPRLENSMKGIHVSGCAGSGKTWMACNEVARLYAKNPQAKILFLCYNRNLADYVLERLLNIPDVTAFNSADARNCRVFVSTFHSMCAELCRFGGISYKCDEGVIAEDTLLALKEYIGSEIEYRYDYIFVDEAQDIRDDWWDYVITKMKKNSRALLYAFSDSNQLIYKEGQEVISLPVRVTLKNNLRNAFDICQLSTAALPKEEQDIIPLPLKSDNYVCSKGFNRTEERARQVETYIEKILLDNKGNGITKKDIVVLSPYVTDSSFNYLRNVVAGPVKNEKLEEAKQRMQDCLSEEICEEDKMVLGETVRSFKGLEAPFVILTDINRPREDSGFTPNDFYVACTRAKYGLYIVPTEEGKKYISKLEMDAVNLPSPLEI